MNRLASIGLIGFVLFSTAVSAGSERQDLGWGGSGGANLEFYGKNHDTQPERAGQMRFIYGGGSAIGAVVFTHYDGAAWSPMMTLDQTGNLEVGGLVKAGEVSVQNFTVGWPDYVFENKYQLTSLDALEQFIAERGHLPEIPTAKEVEDQGINIGDMNARLLKKVEELTLYVIELNKQNRAFAEKLAEIGGNSQ